MKRANHRLTLISAGFLTTLVLAPGAFGQSTGYLVTVNTSSLNGQTGNIDLQFDAGALTTQNACVNVSHFLTDGSLGSPSSTTGSVTGTLATSLTINNGSSGCTTSTTYTASTFNDYNQPITFGNTLSFYVVLNGPGVTAPAGNNNGNSGSSFGVAFTSAGSPAFTGDPSNFAGTIVLNPDGTVTTTGLPGPGNTSSLVTIQSAELVTVTTSPSGLSFSVDSASYSSSQTFAWAIGSGHTLTTTSPQPGTTGTEYTFNQWSDGTTTLSDSIIVSTSTTSYTAQFNTEYLLTTAANPSADGSVTVNTTSPTGDNYFPSGTQVSIQANANTGYQFTSWTGNVANANSASTTVTMTAPESVTANFGVDNVRVTVGTSPTGLSFTVDSTHYTTTQTFTWQVSSTHNVSTTTPQGVNGNTYSFSSWSGGNSPTSTSESITVSGAATYTANFTSASALAFSANTLAFTATNVGSSRTLSITVTNKGSSSVTFNSVTASGDYSVLTDGCTTLASNGTCTVQVQFSPTTYGSRTGTLSFNDTGAGSPQSVGLTGTGVGAQLAPSSLYFSAQHGNTTSATQTLTLTNFLNTSLTYGAASFSGANSGDFPIQSGGSCSTGGGALAARGTTGSSCTYVIAFHPTANGSEAATLSVTDTAGTQSSSFTGTGVGAQLAPPAGAFPSQLGNTTSTTTLTITFTNYLSSPLSYTPTWTGTNAGDFPVQGSSTCATPGGPAGLLPANASCTYVVAFHPTANGAETATLSINDADGTQTSTFTGTGVGAQLAPPTNAFGSYAAGHPSAAKTLTLTNYLSSTLSITGTSFGGTNSGDFSVNGGTCQSGSVAANSSCTYSVIFTPSTNGAESASITVTDGDGTQTATLTGTGVGAQLAPPTNAFGSYPKGHTSTPITLTLTNDLSSALSITGVTFGGSNPVDFARSGGTCPYPSGMVSGKSSCTYLVTFTPSTTGAESASINVADGDGTQTATLSGSGH